MKRQKYDHKKLEGNDMDIETSLKEYGLAWIETETEYLFYYGIEVAEDECHGMEYTTFDFISMDKDTDIKAEFDWVAWDEFLEYLGCTQEQFNQFLLPQKITDMMSYYGFESVFGSSYWVGLKYNDFVPSV